MIGATVKGIPELKEALNSIVPKLRRQALRNALAAGARVVRDAARSSTPVLRLGTRAPYRKPGTVKKAITVRTSKLARKRGDVGVFVNVRPAKKGARGAKNPNDPFYWRWLNFGWNPPQRSDGAGKKGKRTRRILNKTSLLKRKAGYRFLEAGAAKLGDALDIFVRMIGPQIQKLNRKNGTL
jgi:HK97 gp10 family phage protein